MLPEPNKDDFIHLSLPDLITLERRAKEAVLKWKEQSASYTGENDPDDPFNPTYNLQFWQRQLEIVKMLVEERTQNLFDDDL